jgi:hypothetical protein
MNKIFCTHLNEFNGLNRREKMIDDFKKVILIVGYENLVDEVCNYLTYNELSDFTADLIKAYNIDEKILM